MWIDTRDCVPLTEGEYIVQTVYGRVCHMNYTTEGGWNTHKDADGTLYTENAIEDLYVARWFDIPTPREVPEIWLEEYREYREGVKR